MIKPPAGPTLLLCLEHCKMDFQELVNSQIWLLHNVAICTIILYIFCSLLNTICP